MHMFYEGHAPQWSNEKTDNKTKGQTTMYKTLHGKLKIEQHEPHQKPEGERMCSGSI